MAWYSKYLQVYEKTLLETPQSVIQEIKEKLKKVQSDTPLVTVALIAHNEEKHLLSCLWSLCDNQCSYPIEILCVNNNSTDNTEKILQAVGVTYFNETKKGPGFARQCGLNQAKGRYHICIDSDTIYPPKYIETHIRALMKPGVVATFGLWSFIPDENHSRRDLWMYETSRDIYLWFQSLKRPELCVRGMVFAFNTELGRKCGFRTDIIRGEDGYLAFQLKEYGKISAVRSRQARPMTGYGTVGIDGSLFNSFKVRMVKALKDASSIFTSKKEYKDQDSNLIKKK